MAMPGDAGDPKPWELTPLSGDLIFCVFIPFTVGNPIGGATVCAVSVAAVAVLVTRVLPPTRRPGFLNLAAERSLSALRLCGGGAARALRSAPHAALDWAVLVSGTLVILGLMIFPIVFFPAVFLATVLALAALCLSSMYLYAWIFHLFATISVHRVAAATANYALEHAAFLTGVFAAGCVVATVAVFVFRRRHRLVFYCNFCVICLDEMEEVGVWKCLPACEHRFHTRCINRWLRRQATCPLCRRRVDTSNLHDM